MDRYEKLIEDFTSHMKENPEVECCGIVTKDFIYVPCKNISARPKESFVLDPYALFKYSDDCWAIFHSHTLAHDDLPSEQDKNSAIFSEYKFIVGNLNGKFYNYWLNSSNYLEFKDFTKDVLEC